MIGTKLPRSYHVDERIGPVAQWLIDSLLCTIYLAGFLASTPDEYAQALSRLFSSAISEKEMLGIRQRARESTQRFSDEVFLGRFSTLFEDFLDGNNGRSNRSTTDSTSTISKSSKSSTPKAKRKRSL